MEPHKVRDRRGIIADLRARQAQLSQHPVAIILFDVDRLRSVNDGLGLIAGDVLLELLVDRLEAISLASSSVVGRMGGDEFAVVCDAAGGIEDARMLANRLNWELERPYRIRDREVVITLSMGITVVEPSVCADEGLNQAGTALYAAKANGGHHLVVFHDELQPAVHHQVDLRTEMREALESQAFEVHYQPVIALDTMAVTGAEALARWHRPNRGWVSPGEFIPVAETGGLIVPLGHWIMRTAVEQLRSWRDDGRDVRMNVNVSARQLASPDLLFQVHEVLAATKLDPHVLTLEITETQVLSNLTVTQPVMESLRGLGVRLAIDDFGTGYASLAYLKRIPADEIKIDRSFTMGMAPASRDLSLVRSLVGLAHALDLRVVAEGVETVDQWRLLTEVGCDAAQGFLLARPAAASDMRFTVDNPPTPRPVRAGDP